MGRPAISAVRSEEGAKPFTEMRQEDREKEGAGVSTGHEKAETGGRK